MIVSIPRRVSSLRNVKVDDVYHLMADVSIPQRVSSLRNDRLPRVERKIVL